MIQDKLQMIADGFRWFTWIKNGLILEKQHLKLKWNLEKISFSKEDVPDNVWNI